MVHGSVLKTLAVLPALARKRRVKLFLVGGSLRDHVLKRPSRKTQDLDFAVSRNAIAYARAFAKLVKGAFVLLDDEAGCARVVRKMDGVAWTFDFADWRAPSMEKDLRERDFTINTLAVEVSDWIGEDVSPPSSVLKSAIHHPFAWRDLKSKTIRLASPKAFVDDPLRLLRAYSLKAQLGFKIEAHTRKQIRKDRELISNVSPERVREELCKVLDSSRAAETLRALDAVGLLTMVIPQIEVMRNVKQGGYHHLDVWNHSLATVAELERLLQEKQGEPDLEAYLNEEIGGGHSRRAILKLACLLHDIGKPDTRKKEPGGRTSFHGHEHIGRRIVRIIAQQLLISSKERYALEDMVTLHLRPGYLSNFKKPSEKAVYRFLREAKDEAVSILLLSTADQRATRGPLTTEYDLKHHEEIAFPLIDAYFAKKKEKPFLRLINGHDLIKVLKLQPGPVFAEILQAVEEAQHLGKVKTRQEALELAKQFTK